MEADTGVDEWQVRQDVTATIFIIVEHHLRELQLSVIVVAHPLVGNPSEVNHLNGIALLVDEVTGACSDTTWLDRQGGLSPQTLVGMSCG